MFKDKKEELQRLAEALMEDDTPTQVLPPLEEEEAEAPKEEPYIFGKETPATYYNYANNYGHVDVYNTDHADTDLESYSDAVYEDPDAKSVRRLMILAACLLLGIAAVLGYCVLRFRGLL